MSVFDFLRDEDLRLDKVAPDEFVTEIDFDMLNRMSPDERLKYMIDLGHYDRGDTLLTADHFPVVGTGKRRFRNRTFHFGIDLDKWEVEEIGDYFGLMIGDHVHGLALGAAFPDLQLKGVVACLGSSAQINSRAQIMSLYKHRMKRHLRCRARDDSFQSHWRFLMVQEI